MATVADSARTGQAHDRRVGVAQPRIEDHALLTGAARFMDDLSPVAGLRHAAIVRSPHAHATIRGIDAERALALPGVHAVVTGAEIAGIIRPIPSVVRAPIKYYPCAVDKVRFVGEPVAVVVADSRYVAEDAAELVAVEYEPLPAVVDPAVALDEGAPVLHEALGSNVVSRRSFRYGDPDGAFARADATFELPTPFPRYASTPMETFGVVAHHEARPDRFTVWSNFQGPFVLQPLMAGALQVPSGRLRLITPQASGGSFGVKQAISTYIVLLAAVSRLCGAPVKWIEDRAEHLTAASASSDRAGRVAGAFSHEGELLGLRFENVANMGAYLRAPEPASLYRMHAASNGCYRVRDIAVDNTLVVTNTAPVGLNRGYGGPQFYFALERLMDHAAHRLGLDPAEIRRRNFIPRDAFPYPAPGGSHYDSGDYEAALDELLRIADYPALLARREAARQEGRLFGIGFGAGVEPSGSNMAYVSLAQTAEERSRGAPKSGALASAVIAMDPSGSVNVQLCSTPNGQGHATVAAQIVAERLGLEVADIDVTTDIDTRTSAWSIASGNYSNRFSAVVAGTIAQCADRVAGKLRAIAGEMLEVAAEDIELADGAARVVGAPAQSVPVRQVAAAAHWNPAGLPAGLSPGIHETVVFSPEVLGSPNESDQVASAVTYGMVIDLAAVEIDPRTGQLEFHRYASVHDVGNQLNPLIVEGQALGGFVHGLGAALFEELAYDADGQFRAATFADYLCPTAPEIPELRMSHADVPSPTNALGAKGMGDGSAMLAPATIANSVADALGRDDVTLPLSLGRLWALANPEAATDEAPGAMAARGPGELGGSGEVRLGAPPAEVWHRLTDPDWLRRIVPGCRELEREGGDRYRAEVEIGVARIRGVYRATMELRDKREPGEMTLVGTATGELGFGRGEGRVRLEPAEDGGTVLRYEWRARVGGKVAAVGQRMLDAVTRILIDRFFRALESGGSEDNEAGAGGTGWLRRLFGRGAGR